MPSVAGVQPVDGEVLVPRSAGARRKIIRPAWARECMTTSAVAAVCRARWSRVRSIAITGVTAPAHEEQQVAGGGAAARSRPSRQRQPDDRARRGR